jgi:hypothetical protein
MPSSATLDADVTERDERKESESESEMCLLRFSLSTTRLNLRKRYRVVLSVAGRHLGFVGPRCELFALEAKLEVQRV